MNTEATHSHDFPSDRLEHKIIREPLGPRQFPHSDHALALSRFFSSASKKGEAAPSTHVGIKHAALLRGGLHIRHRRGEVRVLVQPPIQPCHPRAREMRNGPRRSIGNLPGRYPPRPTAEAGLLVCHSCLSAARSGGRHDESLRLCMRRGSTHPCSPQEL